MKQRYKPLTLQQRTAQLEKIIADAAQRPFIRRAAATTLARLQRATRPAPNVESILAGKRQALDVFLVLAAQRSALLRRFNKLKADELEVLNCLLENMPDKAPELRFASNQSQREQTQTWINFVQGVIACLRAVKRLPNQPTTNKRKQ